MDKQKHLNRIKAKCISSLALAEKRTEGKWKAQGAEIGWSKVTGSDGHSLAMCHPSIAARAMGKLKGDSAFIAACAGPAEAGWRSTIAAIEAFEMIVQSPFLDGTESGEIAQGDAERAISTILDAWQEELL